MSRRLQQLRRRQDGWAVVTVVIVMTVMVSLGLATLAFVDGQTGQAARERLQESGFNLAEGALTQQMYILTRQWPGSAATQYPSVCPSAAQPQLCPDGTVLRANYNTVDYGGAPQWTTEVHDNDTGDTPNFYNDAAPDPNPWDRNGDGKVWVRAQATVKGRTRVVLGLVEIERFTEDLPKAALISGTLQTSNNGNKAIICTRVPNPGVNDCTSSSSLAGPVQLRCLGALVPGCNNTRSGQVAPDAIQYGYTGQGLDAAELDRLRSRAISDGTYFTSCPPTPNGAVVFVESGNCSYSDSTVWGNSATKPGVFILNNGTLTLTGNQTFYGVIYAVNAQGAVGCTPACPVTVTGTVTVRGGVQVGGMGAYSAGSSKLNIIFDPFAFDKVQSYGAAGLVQNKWREIPPRAGT